MSPGPDFDCDFYCAVWDGLRGRTTGRHGTGSPPLPSGVAGRPRWGCSRGVEGLVARSSGSRRAYKGVQCSVLVGRPGTGLRSCQTSLFGSIRRGR
jgi:hypothetical protein